MIIQVLSAIPSSGKTKAILDHIATTGQKAIVASISRELSQQSYEYYTMLGKPSILIDYDHSVRSVNSTLKREVKYNDVIFITHKALFNFTHFNRVQDFNLYIDEVPDLITFKQYSFGTNSNMVLDYCKPINEGVHTLDIKPGMRRKLKEKAMEGYDLKDDVHNMLFPIYKSLLTGVPVTANVTKDNVVVQFIEDRSCKDWDCFKTITIACNNLYDTFTGMVMKYVNKWEFVASPLEEKLLFKEYRNSSRVTINVMYEKDWSKYAANKINNKTTNFCMMCDVVKSKSNEFLYTVNKVRGKLSGGISVSYNPHGLNSFSNHTDAFVAFSFNPQPWQIPVLEQLALSYGLERDKFTKAFVVEKYLEPAFQLCSRTNIRDDMSDKEINLYVPDDRCANYIKKYVPDAVVNNEMMIYDQVKTKVKQTRKKRYTFDNILGMTQQEKQRFAHVRVKFKKLNDRLPDPNNTEDMEYVTSWLQKSREKHSK